MNTFFYIIIRLVAAMFLWTAVEYKRTPKIKPYSKDWWYIFLYLMIAWVIVDSTAFYSIF